MFEIDYWILVAQIINFLILFFIFKKFISDNLDDLIIERKANLEKIYKADFYYDEKIKEAKILKEKILSEAHKEADSRYTEIEELANIKAKKLIDKANKDIKNILESWKKEIENERLEMLKWIENNVIDLSIELNKKLFLDKTLNQKLINEQLKTKLK